MNHDCRLPGCIPIAAASCWLIHDISLDMITSICVPVQSIKPLAAWDTCTLVRIEELYRNILEGQLDMLLPLANKQAPEQPVALGRLIAMPVRQHLQLQVMIMTFHALPARKRASSVSAGKAWQACLASLYTAHLRQRGARSCRMPV